MNERQSKDALLSELELAGATIRGKDVVCPFHEDRSPSGSVHADEGGVWRYRCHAVACGFSGDVYDMRAKATGRPLEEILKEANPPAQKRRTDIPRVYATVEEIEAALPGRLERRYTYTHPVTRKPDLIVLRFISPEGKKQFRQASPVPGGFVQRKPASKQPLYNRIAMQGADTVIIVEGENCVHALREAGHVATTSPAGAGNAPYADWTPVSGKNCYLWADNDEAGQEHMRGVERILTELSPPCRISRIDPSDLDLPEKGDSADLIEQLKHLGKGPEDLQAEITRIVQGAQPAGVLDDFQNRISAIVRGEYSVIEWPWPTVTKLTRALLPGAIIIVAGRPGASKSLMLLQAALYWYASGINFSLFELEGDRPYHLFRCLAQLTRRREFTDPDWVRLNPEYVTEAVEAHRSTLEGFTRHLYTSDSLAVETLEQLAQWIDKQGKQGRRVVCIDPITAATRTKKPWEADADFIRSVKRTATEHGVSVVLISHPQKGEAEPTMHNLAGAAAYERFVDTIVTLHSHDPKESLVAGCCGTSPITHNRTVRIDKSRNGPGTGYRLAFQFEKESLLMSEEGVVTRKK